MLEQRFAESVWPGGWSRPNIESSAGPAQLVERLPASRARHQATYAIAKRAFDLAVATLALLLVGPLLVLIGLLVRLDSPGPILYRQSRIGFQGRRFYLYKFRTMVADRRTQQLPIDFADRRHCLKTAADPRITRIGRLLRKTSLDELPQSLNVLRGEMSLVGPRPELPDMLPYYRPPHCYRHAVVPGLTGWWQVNGRCRRADQESPEADLDQKLVDDLYYLEHRSFWLDLRILLRTVQVVLAGRGAF